MLRRAPASDEVMRHFAEFIGSHNLVAHNASFDLRFLRAELQRVRRRADHHVGCSMLAARRLYQDAPNHKLGTLVKHLALPTRGTYHRALADAEMTAHLWKHMLSALASSGVPDVSFANMLRICRTSKSDTAALIRRLRP